jgi:hypothetical protein
MQPAVAVLAAMETTTTTTVQAIQNIRFLTPIEN